MTDAARNWLPGKNQSITIDKAKRIAKGAGWYITDDQEWFCQECGDTVERAEKILMGELWEQEGSEGEKNTDT